jgi:CIC family chloride channel protein
MRLIKVIEKIKNTKSLSDTLEVIILAFVAAISAIVFQLGTNFVFSSTYLKFAKFSKFQFLMYSFITIISASLISGFLLFKLSPEAAGSGIPQAKVAYKKDMGYIPIKPVLVKFIGGIISVGGGLSLGREGPSVYLGAGFASNLDGFLGKPKNFRRRAILIGSAASLAAAFNTPLAAIVFVIEEILNDLNNKNLGFTFFAAVIGAMTVHALVGNQPAFRLVPIEKVSAIHYLVVPFVAIVSSLLGSLFQKWTISLRGEVKRRLTKYQFINPFFGGLLTWVLGSSIFLAFGKLGVFGLGYQDLSDILSGNYLFIIAGFITLAKLFSTIFSYGFGGCGGIFAPSLFIGASSGYFLANIAAILIPLSRADITVLSVSAMSAFLGAVVRAPLTSILIVFEMTHQFSMVPSLVIAVFISQIVASLINKENFYDAIIKQDGISFHEIKVDIDKSIWQTLPVKNIMNSQPICINLENIYEIDEILKKYNYKIFPVFLNAEKTVENCLGTITRERLKDLIDKIKDKQILVSQIKLNIDEPTFCYEDDILKDIANKFANNKSFVILVLRKNTNKLCGISSIHDLVRAQVEIYE